MVSTSDKAQARARLLLSQYSHAQAETMVWVPEVGKNQVRIACQHEGCAEHRMVYTSDLFQVRLCFKHTEEARKARKKAKKAVVA